MISLLLPQISLPLFSSLSFQNIHVGVLYINGFCLHCGMCRKHSPSDKINRILYENTLPFKMMRKHLQQNLV